MSLPFNAARLEVARRRRGMMIQSLAAAIGISRQALSALERGDSEPSDATFRRIVETLGFPAAFYLKGDPDSFDPNGVSFRSMSKMTARQRDSVVAAGTLALEFSRYIEGRFNVPCLDVPDLRHSQPEAAATQLRMHWGLGTLPAPNMVHLLESRGIRVFSLAEDCVEVDAYSAWFDGKAFVFLNTLKSGEHGRFDAAHELGHLVLHRHGAPQGREAESEANAFAAAFLMPSASVLASAKRHMALDALVLLKKTWNVSVAALVRRLFDLKIISDWDYQTFSVELAKRGWRRKEPDGIQRETSLLFWKVFRALRESKVSRLEIEESLGVAANDINELVFRTFLHAISGGRAADLGERQMATNLPNFLPRQGTLKLVE